MINVSDLKPGVTFQMDGNLFVVLDYSHNKTARAAANVKVKMKNLRTGSTTEMTFGGNDKVKRAQIDKKEMQYLYNTGDAFVFMDGETYDIAFEEEIISRKGEDKEPELVKGPTRSKISISQNSITKIGGK